MRNRYVQRRRRQFDERRRRGIRDELRGNQRGLQELLRGAAGVALIVDGESSLSGFRVTLHEGVVDLPRTWKKPRRIFVNSMSDLFHPDVPLWFIRRVFKTMQECPQHSFQVLTKRSDRVRKLSSRLPWPKNLWMGVSVEDSRVFHRIDDLREVPAAIRFLSCEPLIGSLAGIDLRDVHWVIVGGESGPHSRSMQIEWVREIFRACRKEKVPFFFKQWGGVRKDLTGRMLGGKTYDEMPRLAA